MSIATKIRDFMSANEYLEDDYDEELYLEDDEPAYEPVQTSNVQVTRTKNEKVLNLQKTTKESEVTFFIPKSASDAPAITKSLIAGKVCLVKIESLSDADAQTIADFIAGAAYALNGEVRPISEDIFIAVPSGVTLRGDFAREVSKTSGISGFFK